MTATDERRTATVRTRLVRSRAAGCIALVLLAGSATSSCERGDHAADVGHRPARPIVASAFAALDDVVATVGGADIELLRLTPPGVDAHEAELSARQVDALSDAALVVYLRGFQPVIDKAITGLGSDAHVLDVGRDLDLLADPSGTDGFDPHAWLDPLNMIAITTMVESALVAADPARADGYRQRAAAYTSALRALNDDAAAATATCRSRILFTGHRSFAYFGRRLGLDTRAVAGISPDDEPSAQELAELAQFVEQQNVRTLFVEAGLPTTLAAALAEETGAATATLDPMETLTQRQLDSGETYVSIQRRNVLAIATGLQCS